ncbi:TAXI family TRAP transporter solute-binding subunit [Methylocystis sp. IM4]|uniref:TAXI family TRAP transporter solute-binding subunit n=2 Tax=unclassified Methylocystis TaxID=2625913 RepID=UPI0031194A7A
MNKREPGIKEKLDSLAKAAREELVSDFELILEHRYLIVALAATLVGIALFSNPPPPGRVVLAAGAPGSSYSAFAEKYKKFFAARGIILEVRQTQGALENARLVTDAGSDVDAAFIQAGLIDPQAAANVRSLGSLNYAPVWLFFRGSDNNGKLQKFMELGQRRIAIGPAESGSYAAAMRLLALNKQPVSRNLVVMPLAEAVAAINRNDLDAVLLVDGVDLGDHPRAGQKSRFATGEFCQSGSLCTCGESLAGVDCSDGRSRSRPQLPPQDTHIVATTTDLVVKETVHPAIQMLFLAAAQAVNGREAFFEKRHEFPSFKNDDLEESEEAKIFYKNGEPFLMRFLPFWLAEFFNRMSFYLFPLFLLSYPTIKLILDYRVKQGRIKINAVYRKLAALENQLTYSFDPFNRENYITQLNTMERTAMALRLPRELSGEYFMLRSSINYIRTCLLRGEPYIEQRHTSPRDQPDPTSLRV